MAAPSPDPEVKAEDRISRILLLIFVLIILGGIAAFLYFRPNPGA